MSDSFYRAFEDRHRGPRELIKSRLGAYVAFIKPLASLYQPTIAIDLGCGRGEWLELIGEIGFDAFGVDLDDGMLAACRERGLNAREADALKTLRELPTDSAALISAFHVVEHMPFDEVQSLVREALRILKPGGLLILETPNPENLVVGSSKFYLDPSHERPIPSELLSFVVEHAGFHRNKVLRLQESSELRTDAKIGLFGVLSGVSPDYGVVAQKGAGVGVLSSFDEAFLTSFGVSLEELAQRYDAQADARAAQAETQATQADARAAQAETRATQADARATQAESKATQVQAQLHDILCSRSWRITTPLRIAGALMHRVRAAIKEQRLLSGTKRRIKSVLLDVGRWAMSQPRLKQAMLLALNRMPAMKQRLRRVIQESANARSGLQAAIHEPSELSPRAARIYDEFKKALEMRGN